MFFADCEQVVLELQNDGKVTTSDDPPVVFGCLDQDFLQKVNCTYVLANSKIHSSVGVS